MLSWLENIRIIEKNAEFLIEECKETKVEKINIGNTLDLMAKFKDLF